MTATTWKRIGLMSWEAETSTEDAKEYLDSLPDRLRAFAADMAALGVQMKVHHVMTGEMSESPKQEVSG